MARVKNEVREAILAKMIPVKKTTRVEQVVIKSKKRQSHE